ncbi:hypothetical protein WN51_06602 [Melipona quadrifasciata]|uniref:Uncharacterized protein n=1 Tax=Melipona quadrifasciata TaxID=166423 RepID=A0A0M8ZRA5_9HYME|nr:hypothetical protein WN51_06602 [Melipona quadrifasciata]
MLTMPLAGLCRQKPWPHGWTLFQADKALHRGLRHGTNFPEHVRNKGQQDHLRRQRMTDLHCGAYDPNLNCKIKGLITKSGRFHYSKSVVSAEGNVTICNKHPQLPGKQNLDQIKTKSSLKLKPCASADLQYDETAEYDIIIENSSKQMDDLKYKYEKEIDRLKFDFEKKKMILVNKNQSEISHRIEIEAKLKNIEEQNNSLREKLQNFSKDADDRLREVHQDLEELQKRYILDLKKHKEKSANVERLHDEEKRNLQHQLENARRLTIAKDKEIAEVKKTAAKKCAEEIKRVKQDADEIVANAEAVTKCPRVIHA